MHVRAVMEVGFIFRPSQQMKVVLSDSSNVCRTQMKFRLLRIRGRKDKRKVEKV